MRGDLGPVVTVLELPCFIETAGHLLQVVVPAACDPSPLLPAQLRIRLDQQEKALRAWVKQWKIRGVLREGRIHRREANANGTPTTTEGRHSQFIAIPIKLNDAQFTRRVQTGSMCWWAYLSELGEILAGNNLVE